MKHYYLLLMVLAFSWQISYAAESEPNNTSSQANTLNLNSNTSGKISPAGDLDWFKVTTNADGKLNLTLKPYSAKSLSLSLYDNNGTTLLTTSSGNTIFTQSTDGLAAGTYYIKISAVLASDTISYNISNTLTVPAEAKDAEPNDTTLDAISLNPNNKTTGHVGYYYKNKRDTTDWYKVTTAGDGLLKFVLTPANGTDTWLYLYDNNGKKLLKSAHSTAALATSLDGLGAGTYYVKIACVTNSQFAPYTLSDTLTQPSQANDAEPNGTSGTSISFSSNSTKSGHVGYYYNLARDTTDWYKLTTTTRQKLVLTLTPANKKTLSMVLYAGNGTSTITTSSNSSAFSLTSDALEAGTYFVKIYAKSTSDYAPYTLKNTLSSPGDTTILPVGYSIKDSIKTPGGVKWFKVSTRYDGKLALTLASLSNRFLYVYLYDHDKTTVLGSNYSSSSFTVTTDGLAVGTYYVKVVPYYATDTSTFTLASSLTVPKETIDAEPNDSRSKAISFSTGSSKTGHVGYFYNNHRDTADWYKITTKSDGLLKLSLTPANGEFVYIYLYDNDGVTLLNSSYSSAAFSQSTDGLAAGTYYVKINCYYNYKFAPYTLKNSLTSPSQANDAEPDSTRATALTLPINSKTTGHVGYYYNNHRDTADWYKITTTADGVLKLGLTPANGEYVWIYLYDNDGVTLLNSSYSTATFSQSTNGLAAGTYYVRVNPYYNSKFAPYTFTDTLVTTGLSNDAEPDSSRATAITLAPNSKTTGHVGYYYKNHRDSADWYKITTTADGYLKLSLTPANGEYVYISLYDNDGVTLLNSSYSSSAFTQNTDGLAAGTYYVKINCYYNYAFAPYTFTDTLSAYGSVTETEPNKYAKVASTVTPNSTSSGHVGFYYNHVKDTLDWWKLNYTGGGNLSFTFNLGTRKSDGGIPNVYFEVYKDTAAAPIFNNYYSSPSNNINLTGLAKANYYIRIRPYAVSDFDTYSFSNTFTVNGALPRPAVDPGTEITGTTDISVYPNPASSQFHIRVANSQTSFVTATLVDANGKQLWTKTSPGLQKNGGLDVDVSKLPAGLYYLQMMDANRHSIVKKIIVAR